MKKILLTAILPFVAVGVCLIAVNGCNKDGGAGGLKTTSDSAEKNSFKEVAAQLDAGGNLYLYLSTEQLLEGLSGKISQWRQFFTSMPDADPEERVNIGKAFDVITSVIKDSGLEDVSGFGASSIATEPGFYRTKAFVHHYPDKGNGFLWKVLGKESHALTGLDLLPANTALATFSDLDVPLAWSVIEKEVGQSGIPQAQEFLSRLPAQFERATGVKWEKVLDSLGGEFGFVLTLDEAKMISLPMGGERLEIPEPALMIVAKVKDPTIFNRLEAVLQQNAGEQVIRMDKGDLKMRTVPVPLPVPIQLRPTVAADSGYLFIASTDAVIQQALAVKNGSQKGLKTTDEFKHLSKNIPTKGNQFTFVSQSFGKTIYQIQRQVLESAGRRNSGARAQWLQSLLRSDRPVFSYSVTANLPDGCLSVGNGNQHPAKMFLASAMIPVGVMSAIAIPNFVRARQASQNNACINNLRQIDGAKQQWALEHNKSGNDTPTESDIQPYLGRGAAGQFPVCPQGGHYTIGALNVNPTCSIPGHSLP